MLPTRQTFTSLAVGLLVTVMPLVALAESNRLVGLTLNEHDEIVLTVEGDGFDPLLQLQPMGDNRYHIIISALGVTLDDALKGNNAQLDSMLARQLPALLGAQFSQSDTGMRIELHSWRKLLPQIRSNSGHEILIALVGDHSRPPEATPPVEPDSKPEVITLEPEELALPVGIHQPQPKFQAQPAKPLSPEVKAPISAPSEDIFDKARRLLATGNISEAAIVLEHGSRTPEAETLLARIYITQAQQADISGDRKLADQKHQQARRLLEDQPRDLAATLFLLQLLLNESDYNTLETRMAGALQHWPEEPMLHFYEGMVYEAQRDTARARESYERAVTINPAHTEGYYRLAQLALAENNLDGARWQLMQALMLRPDDPRFHKLLGYLQERDHQPELANEQYRRSLQPEVMINVARLLGEQGQRQEALAIYRAVEALYPDEPGLLYNLGMLYAKLDEPQRAEAVLERFVTLADKSGDDRRVVQARAMLSRLSKQAP